MTPGSGESKTNTKIYRISKNSLKIKKGKKKIYEKAVVVFLPGVRSNHLIPLSTQVCFLLFQLQIITQVLSDCITTSFKWTNYSKTTTKIPFPVKMA